jgi:hypothetical protein
VLELPLICFEAAADSIRPLLLAYSIRLWSECGVLSYNLWDVSDLRHKSPTSDYLFEISKSVAPAFLPEAMARWNLCDYFASLLEEEFNGLMEARFGGATRWYRMTPEPDSALLSVRHQAGKSVCIHA